MQPFEDFTKRYLDKNDTPLSKLELRILLYFKESFDNFSKTLENVKTYEDLVNTLVCSGEILGELDSIFQKLNDPSRMDDGESAYGIIQNLRDSVKEQEENLKHLLSGNNGSTSI